jgi:hypothetical protein
MAEDPFAALKAAEVAEFVPTSPDVPSDSPASAAENVPVETSPDEPAGETPPSEELAPPEASEGVESGEPSEPAGQPPADEEPVSGADDYAVALRAAGGDPNNIPKKLREVLDNYSRVNNELAKLKKEAEAHKAEAPPATPTTLAQPATVAPASAAPTSAVQPDPQAIEREISTHLGQDADYTRAARAHYANLSERVSIVGGTNDRGERVKGALAEIEEKIAALEKYNPETMKTYGIELDEFALSQINPDKIASTLAILESKKTTLEARDITLQIQNQQYESRMLGRQNLITQAVTSRLTSATREEQEVQEQDDQATKLAETWNQSLASLSKQHGLTDEDEIVNASLRAQKAARANPDEAIRSPATLIEAEVKRAVARLDKFKRDGVRASAIRKDAATKPQAPPGPAAVASPNPSSSSADPFAALKQSDRARYVGAR